MKSKNVKSVEVYKQRSIVEEFFVGTVIIVAFIYILKLVTK